VSYVKDKFGVFAALFLIVSLFYSFTFLPCKAHKHKVYDCFLFYNELELLELRLNELDPYVDKFVIVEACETFRGQPKSFFFDENKSRYEKYADKIIHIKLSEPFKTENPWIRERYQREQIFQGLTNCCENDIIMLSDLDEVPRGTSIPEIVDKISSKEYQAIICGQKMYYGYLNRYQGGWPGTVCINYKKARKLTARWVRKLRNMRPSTLRKGHISKICRVENAGWHFTSMGGIDRYIKKIESFSHSELDTPEFKTKENLLKLIHSMKLEEIDDSYPQFIRDNRAYFERLGFIDMSGILGTSEDTSSEPVEYDD
jgi:hypothetical protein